MIIAAEVIALARALYPELTVEAASDEFMGSWLSNAYYIAGFRFENARALALAHLIAHAAFRIDPEGELNGGGGSGSSGAITSVTTGALSVGYSDGSASAGGSVGFGDAELSKTKAGAAYLMLRGAMVDINVATAY